MGGGVDPREQIWSEMEEMKAAVWMLEVGWTQPSL